MSEKKKKLQVSKTDEGRRMMEKKKVVGAGEGLILTEHLHTQTVYSELVFTISFNPLSSVI